MIDTDSHSRVVDRRLDARSESDAKAREDLFPQVVPA
jgi:hypothetical protein